MADEEMVKLIIEVGGGVFPGTPSPEFERRFVLTSKDWEARGVEALREVEARADRYMRELRNPSRMNWVVMEWVWL